MGFKGMTFGDSDGGNVFGSDPYGRPYDVNYVYWLDPRVGNRAYTAYTEYRDQCLHRNYNTGKIMPQGWLKHPWLFINLTPEAYGAPLSYSALQSIWNNLLDRLYRLYGIDLRERGLGWHSLRHFYGWYCASILGLDITTTKALMHHGLVESTQVYFVISPKVAHNKIYEGVLKGLGYKKRDVDLIISPNTPDLAWPNDWVGGLFKRRLMDVNLGGIQEAVYGRV